MLALILVAGIVMRLSNQLMKNGSPRDHNLVAGPIYGAIAVTYAILLALVIGTVWGEFLDAENAVEAEAASIAGLYRLASSADIITAEHLRLDLVEYARSIVDKEWPVMADEIGRLPRNPAYDRLWRTILMIQPQGVREEAELGSLINGMDRLDSARSARVLSSTAAIPVAMWIYLIAGGAVTVLFAALFGAANRRVHLTMVTFLVIVLALALLMVKAIDHPFKGIIHVEPDAYKILAIGLDQ